MRNLLVKISLFIGGMALIGIMLTCGTKEPAVTEDKYKTPRFDHTGLTSGCAECHEKERPVDPHPQKTDCGTCHKYGKWEELATEFTHVPEPSSCAACHEKTRPKRKSHAQTGDCKSCHKFPEWVPSGDSTDTSTSTETGS